MDFDDTPEEAAFRREARTWLGANAERLAERAPREISVRAPEAVQAAQRWQAKKADAGWACITWPKEYGGRGGTPVEDVIWSQEEAWYDTPPNIFAIGIGMLGPTLMAHGTPQQKERYLPKMLRGEEIWSQLFSEPGAGSDLAGLRTAAVRSGDDWLISGQKIWTSGAHYSRFGMVLTRTDPGVQKHRGITYFIVDLTGPGVEIRPIKQMNGGSAFSEVFFSEVRVPDANRVGEVNGGWRAALTTLMNERAAIGGGGPGPGFAELAALAKETHFGTRTAFEDPSIRDALARFYIRQKGLEYTGYRTLTALSRGQTPGPEASLGKLVGAPLRQEMASFACDLLGAAGAIQDPQSGVAHGAWQELYLRAPGGRIAGGSDEIMRNIIAERVLGLPPEVRVDKDVPFNDLPAGTVSSDLLRKQ